MAVTKVNLLQDILSFLKNNLGATDPLSTRPSTSKFILTSYPQRQVVYPIITIKASNITATRMGLQTTGQNIIIKLEIRIWARNEKEKDSLYDQIINNLANIQYTASTGSIANNLHDFTVLSSVEVDEPGEPGQGGIKSRILQCSYGFYNLT